MSIITGSFSWPRVCIKGSSRRRNCSPRLPSICPSDSSTRTSWPRKSSSLLNSEVVLGLQLEGKGAVRDRGGSGGGILGGRGGGVAGKETGIGGTGLFGEYKDSYSGGDSAVQPSLSSVSRLVSSTSSSVAYWERTTSNVSRSSMSGAHVGEGKRNAHFLLSLGLTTTDSNSKT